jgi:hypothetical protein
MIMPGSQRISGEAFAIERLRANPDLDYATLRREAGEAGVSMQPIQYGRARKQLGLPPMQKPGPKILAPAPVRDDADADANDGESTAGDDASDDPVEARDEDGEGESDDAGDDEAARRDTDRTAAAGDIVAPKRKGSAAFDFLVQELRREPNLAYGTLRERSEARGWKIAPIMYGRAKAVLGLVPVRPRGSAKKAAAAAEPAAPRVLKQVESVAADRFHKQLEDVRNLEQLVGVVKELDSERRRLRALLERIVALIDEALG